MYQFESLTHNCQNNMCMLSSLFVVKLKDCYTELTTPKPEYLKGACWVYYVPFKGNAEAYFKEGVPLALLVGIYCDFLLITTQVYLTCDMCDLFIVN